MVSLGSDGMRPGLSSCEVVLPRDGPLRCQACNEEFPTFGKLEKHNRTIHNSETPVSCSRCNRTWSSYLSGSIHASKCSGPGVNPQLPFKCLECLGSSFTSARGLSQHQRHRHPDTANRKRWQQVVSEESKRNTRRVWSRADEVRFMEIMNEYEGRRLRDLVARLQVEFGNKTITQIENKRKAMRKRSRAGVITTPAETRANRDPVSETNQ